jgi:biotin operon repressor
MQNEYQKMRAKELMALIVNRLPANGDWVSTKVISEILGYSRSHLSSVIRKLRDQYPVEVRSGVGIRRRK